LKRPDTTKFVSGSLFASSSDPKRLNALAHEPVSILFFGINLANPVQGLSLDQELTVQLGLQQNAGRMAEYGGELSHLIALRGQPMDAFVVVIGVHRRLSANGQEGLKIRDLELTDRLRILNQAEVFRRTEDPSDMRSCAEYLLLTRGSLQLSAWSLRSIRTVNIHLVPVLLKIPIRVS
jgi:hypothetical protein